MACAHEEISDWVHGDFAGEMAKRFPEAVSPARPAAKAKRNRPDDCYDGLRPLLRRRHADRDHLRDQLRGRRRQRPSEMAMPRVVENARKLPRPTCGIMFGSNRPQSAPRHHAIGFHARNKWRVQSMSGSIRSAPDVAVEAVEFRRTGDPKAVRPETTADNLGFVVEQADARCRRRGYGRYPVVR